MKPLQLFVPGLSHLIGPGEYIVAQTVNAILFFFNHDRTNTFRTALTFVLFQSSILISPFCFCLFASR